MPNLQNTKNRKYGLTKLLKEASPQAVLITRGNKTETSSSSPAEDDSNLPDLAHLVLADEDMERDKQAAEVSGRAVEHEIEEKPEGVLHEEELNLLLKLYGRAIQPGGPGTRYQTPTFGETTSRYLRATL